VAKLQKSQMLQMFDPKEEYSGFLGKSFAVAMNLLK